MITPQAIQKKDFTRGVRGYKEEEVDQFLDLISADLNALLRENAALKDDARNLNQEIERYRNSEKAVLGTLEAAKALMNEISSSAEKRAVIVLKNAEMDAERIRREARESVEQMKEEAIALSRRWELFSARFRNLIETELDRFDSFSAGMMFDDEAAGRPASNRDKAGAAKPYSNPLAQIDPDKTFKSPKVP